jgi:hypothetical protein
LYTFDSHTLCKGTNCHVSLRYKCILSIALSFPRPRLRQVGKICISMPDVKRCANAAVVSTFRCLFAGGKLCYHNLTLTKLYDAKYSRSISSIWRPPFPCFGYRLGRGVAGIYLTGPWCSIFTSGLHITTFLQQVCVSNDLNQIYVFGKRLREVGSRNLSKL